MKKIPFTKMVGAGNDFVVVENTNKIDPKKLAVAACARETGIGADGLLILDRSKKADYKMRIINSDGSEAEMCGNGARCMAAYIVQNKAPKNKLFKIETLAGIVLAQAKDETAVVRLSDPKDYDPEIHLNVNGQKISVSYIDTGVPHVVIFVDGLAKIDVDSIGRIIRHHERFKPRGTNVNFVEQRGHNLIEVRTFERGVEGETLACGTGSVAVGIIGFLKANPAVNDQVKANMKVLTRSGETLDVTFNLTRNRISDVWLKGSAKFIAKGEYYV